MSIQNAGRDNAVTCLVMVILLVVGAFGLHRMLDHSTSPFWRGVGEVEHGWAVIIGVAVGALVALFAVTAIVMRIVTLVRRRRWKRLEAILAGEREAGPGEVERLGELVLEKKGYTEPYRGLAESEVLLETARTDGPHRLLALRLLLRHGPRIPGDQAYKQVIREGKDLFEDDLVRWDERYWFESWTGEEGEA